MLGTFSESLVNAGFRNTNLATKKILRLWEYKSYWSESDPPQMLLFSSLPGPKTLFLDRYYFHPRVCVCVSVCVCVWVFISIISKSSWPILMTLGRMIDYDKRQIPFEDELNQFIRTEVTKNPYFYFFLITSLWYYFSDVTSPFLLLER